LFQRVRLVESDIVLKINERASMKYLFEFKIIQRLVNKVEFSCTV